MNTDSNDDGPPAAAGTKARAKRDSLFLLAEVIRETGEAVGNARIRNLSATGLMADCETQLLNGDRLVFDLRGIGPVPGSVRWVSIMRIGVGFDREIDPQAARKPRRHRQGQRHSPLCALSRHQMVRLCPPRLTALFPSGRLRKSGIAAVPRRRPGNRLKPVSRSEAWVLAGRPAAIDADIGAGDVDRRVRAQEQGDVRHLLGRHEPAWSAGFRAARR